MRGRTVIFAFAVESTHLPEVTVRLYHVVMVSPAGGSKLADVALTDPHDLVAELSYQL